MTLFRPLLTVALLAVAPLEGVMAGSLQLVKLTQRDDLMAVKERLVSSFKFNLSGAQRYAAWSTTLKTPADFEPFAQEYARVAVAEMEYRWKNPGGQTKTTLYHAVSGRTPPAILARPGGAVVPQYHWPDWKTYLADKNPDVYAHIPADEPSILENALSADPRPGIGRAYDAEMRGIRTIERDILSGNVPRGGSLVTWVSQPPCAACRVALRMFATTYDVNIKVYHLPAPEEETAEAFHLLQQTKNKITRDFYQRVANYRERAPRMPCRR